MIQKMMSYKGILVHQMKIKQCPKWLFKTSDSRICPSYPVVQHREQNKIILKFTTKRIVCTRLPLLSIIIINSLKIKNIKKTTHKVRGSDQKQGETRGHLTLEKRELFCRKLRSNPRKEETAKGHPPPSPNYILMKQKFSQKYSFANTFWIHNRILRNTAIFQTK